MTKELREQLFQVGKFVKNKENQNVFEIVEMKSAWAGYNVFTILDTNTLSTTNVADFAMYRDYQAIE
jgi:hypothetical protein